MRPKQGTVAAASICGATDKAYNKLPWFWSDQYDLKLQIAGLSQGYDELVVRGDRDAGRSFAAFYLKEGKLISADCVNRPQEFYGLQASSFLKRCQWMRHAWQMRPSRRKNSYQAENAIKLRANAARYRLAVTRGHKSELGCNWGYRGTHWCSRGSGVTDIHCQPNEGKCPSLGEQFLGTTIEHVH